MIKCDRMRACTIKYELILGGVETNEGPGPDVPELNINVNAKKNPNLVLGPQQRSQGVQ